jgi:hypothetical protein
MGPFFLLALGMVDMIPGPSYAGDERTPVRLVAWIDLLPSGGVWTCLEIAHRGDSGCFEVEQGYYGPEQPEEDRRQVVERLLAVFGHTYADVAELLEVPVQLEMFDPDPF